MNCPTCTDERLVLTERSSIEIDYCPACRGVWLDRGELDKIIERSSVPARSEPARTGVSVDERDRSGPPARRYDDDDDDDFRWGNGKDKSKKKKSSFLSELFEF